ncbi:hypothetical protein [Colwellia hornerae]|uniref:Uncharacterized protein n=1 Tax=Colwellia hornerae TaxID=89402 RepID=A0A5C6QEI9_9GAMM|nr:hypothetical protein [Colwellia hornerae]TWX59429.1 hypothetical protein ESZ28_00335 [Colwellia hornerae]TWX62799.1 hypothetical protein ESZ26_00330 [Colwellia hornerae]TWX67113.1 hypothetical protein ESZ27_09570 [Colwellia hornerae]
MKSHIKTLALSAIFSIIGLCCTLSTASAESSNPKMNKALTTITYMFAFPKVANEGGAKEKPLLKPDNGLQELNTCTTTTKNEYFELAIIFNDKLQQLISTLFVDDKANTHEIPLQQLTQLD